jgi:hypothetical protein
MVSMESYYRSLLGAGFNVALFDCSAAELINCGLYETKAVEFKFAQCNNPYFITKHYEQLQKQKEPADASKAKNPRLLYLDRYLGATQEDFESQRFTVFRDSP